MRIKSLKLHQFRVYQSCQLHFQGELVFFIGDNGSGKTSLLEAIHHLAVLRSFRRGKDNDLILWQEKFYTIEAQIETNQKEILLHVGYGRNHEEKKIQRSLLIDKEKIKRMSDFIGKLQLVVFTPDDMDFVDTTMSERRRFFDILLSSLYPAYLEALQNYKRIAERRSHLLKSTSAPNLLYFEAIDKELAKPAVFIMTKREEFLKEFTKPFAHYISMISAQQDDWQLLYQPSMVLAEVNVAQYQKALQKNLPKDLQTRQNSLGIHRDKIYFQHPQTKKDVQLAASQGQKRTVALALRMAQFDMARHISKETPVVLIDDVLNELDLNRRTRFITFLQEIGQAFVTTTDLTGMEKFIWQQKQKMLVEVFQVQKNGQIVLLE